MEGATVDPFAMLPEELIVLIMSFLEGIGPKLRMELVCARFYSISLAYVVPVTVLVFSG